MSIVLNPLTEQLLEARMKQGGYGTADEVVFAALKSLERSDAGLLEDLDPGTIAAIERGEAQADRGEGRPWQAVRAELEARFSRKQG